MPSYSFKSSLIAGQLGESRFAMLYPQMKATDGLTYDFISTISGLRYEVKTERRRTIDTPNVALELSSSHGRRGALHNAKLHSDIIVFQFNCGTIFAYDINKLYYWTKHNKHKHLQVKVSNVTYMSTVLLAPRHLLKTLEVPIV